MRRKITACGHEKKLFTITNRERIICKAIKTLKKTKFFFDAISVSGYSSAIIAPIIAHKLKKNIVLVRKSSEQRYSNYSVEGQHGQRVLFLDDLIDSGKTFEWVKSGVETIGCHIVAVYLYEDDRLYPYVAGVKYV